MLAALCLSAALPALAAPGAAKAATEAPMVNGLIVQLRDAPSHVALARERALGAAEGVRMHEREHARWQDMIKSMPPLRIAERRAVGASAQLMRFERPMTAAQAQVVAAQLAQRADVAWIAPNTRERRLQAANAPTDPLFGGTDGQWWLQPVAGSDGLLKEQRLRGVPGFQTVWTSVTTGSSNSVIAVLDSGIVDHPDLAGKIILGYDMVSEVEFSNDGNGRDADPSDPGDWVDSTDLALPAYRNNGCVAVTSSWHGTAIAGMLVATANNGQGGASMNWPGKVLAVRVAAKCGADVTDIVDGMRWAAGLDVCANAACTAFLPRNPNPARVINISFGGTGECIAYDSTIQELLAMGVVVVAAAGNEHAALPTRPAKCAGVIGVGALNRDGFKATYSNFGSGLVVSTVGGDDAGTDGGAWASRVADSGLLSVGNVGDTTPNTTPQGSSYFNYFGTSFSTPIVAGAVSLMLAVNPALTAQQIERGLRASARPHVTSSLPGVAACSDANPGRCLCTIGTCGAGILDVPQALAYAAAPGSYVAPTRQAAVINAAELRDAAALGPDRPSNTPTTTPPATGNSGGGGGGGGGGAMSALWLLALSAAVLALRRRVVPR